MSELPRGWLWTSVSDVTLGVPNVNPQLRPDRHFGYVDISSINNEDYKITQVKKVKGSDAPSRARRPIQPDDVLFSNVRTYLRNVAIVRSESEAEVCSTGFTVLRSNGAVDPRYLFRWVLTERFIKAVTPQQTGTHYPATSDRVVKAQVLPLPPLNEQRRIVTKLEKLLSRVGAAQARLGTIPRILKRFRQSVLAAACSGRLTADWRENNPDVEDAERLLDRLVTERKVAYSEILKEAETNGNRKPKKLLPDSKPDVDIGGKEFPSTWAITSVGFLAHVTKLAGFEYTKHIHLQIEGDIPVVRAQNVQMGEFVEENVKYISEDVSNLLERSQLHGREILMVFIGAGTGNVCRAPTNRRWHLAPNVAKIDISGVDPEYLLLYLQSPTGLASTLSFAKATAQPSLSMQTIRQIAVLLPPLREQQEIVRRVEALFKTADALEARYGKAKAHVDKLTQSILAKAFRGELVPQDPNDEPASALLERIQQARNGKVDKRRSRK